MANPEFKIKENGGYIRWINREKYVKRIEKFNMMGKKNRFAIFMVTYNNHENVKNMVSYFASEELVDKINFIIIDNSTDEDVKYKNESICKDFNNIIYIETTGDIGADGGCALGMEYSLFSGYKYITIVEDDVVFLNDNIFSEVYKKTSPNKIVFINESKNTGNCHSRYVHFGCYPSNFIERCGVTDLRYFIRSGDIEWSKRIEKTIRKYGYKKIQINKNYVHPYLKRGNGKIWWIYFSIRNQLFMYEKHPSISSLLFFGTIFFYIRYGISKILIEQDIIVFSTFILSISDFLFNRMGINHNEKRLNELSQKKSRELIHKKEILISRDELKIYTKDKSLIRGYNIFSPVDKLMLKYRTGLSNLILNGTVISGYSSPIYPIFILAPKIISIDEFDLIKGNVYVSIYENKYKFIIIKVLISLLISLIILCLLVPIIIVKFVVYRIHKFGSNIAKYFIKLTEK